MVARIHQPARQPIGQQNCRRPDSVIVALHVPVTGAERDAALCHGEIQKAPAPRWKRGPLEATTGRCSACQGVLCGGLAEAGLGALGRRAGGFAFAGQRRRSVERRVGKEWGSTGMSRGGAYTSNKKKT